MSEEEKEIKIDVVKLALATQLAVFGVIGLDFIGINMPIIRVIVVFIYLIFIPGLLILKVLEIKTNLTKHILLSIGISVSVVTLLSTVGNAMISPFYDKPISKIPLIIIIGGFTLLLTVLCRYNKNNYSVLQFDPPRQYLLLFPLLLPIMIIIGKAEGNEFLVFMTLIIISILPPIVILARIDQRLYPLLIWALSSSMMFIVLIFEHTPDISLISWKTGEVVKIAGAWDPSFRSTHNSLLFPMVFHPVFSIFSEMDIVIGTRAIDCVLFSFIPLALFEIFKKFLDPISSFFAACLYIFYPFHLQLVTMNRTGFAFLFVSLFLLLVLSKEIESLSLNILLISFSFSIITSHYGTAYMFMFLLIPVSLLYLYDKKFRKFREKFISPNFIVLFIAIAFSWYMYTSKGENFKWGVSFLDHILMNLKEFFSPEESAAMSALTTRTVTPSFSLEVTKWLLVILLLFIIIGAVKLLYLYFKNKIDAKYAILTLAFSSVLVGITQMGVPRIFGFSLLLTAPLAIWGLSEILKLLRVRDGKTLLIFSLYLFILFAFNYGIVANSINGITGEAKDMSLAGTFREKILAGDNRNFKRFIYWGWEPDSTIKASEWLFLYQNPNKRLFLDSIVIDSQLFKLNLPKEYAGTIVCNLTAPRVSRIDRVLGGDMGDGYIFLASHNVRDNFIFVVDEKGTETYYKTSNYQGVFEGMNKIYNSGGGLIYAT